MCRKFVVLGACLLMPAFLCEACARKELSEQCVQEAATQTKSNCILEPVVTFDIDKKNNKFFKCCCYNPTNDIYEFSCSKQKDKKILINLNFKINPNDSKKSLLNQNSNDLLIATIAHDKSAGLPEILHQTILTTVTSNKSEIVLNGSFTITPDQHAILENIASASEKPPYPNEDLVINIYKKYKGKPDFNDVNSLYENLVGHFEVKPTELVLMK